MLADGTSLGRIFATVTMLIVGLTGVGNAQTDSARIFGFVVDGSGHYLENVDIELFDLDRGLHRKVTTNSAGFYTFDDVRPAKYRLRASAIGFQTADVPELEVVVQDNINQNFLLVSGALSAATIQGPNVPINITGAIGTVVDTDLVANLPLNGRSFQTLFQLVPGVVITPTTFASQGQFSVNGQRTDTNYFVVDGVSANFAIAGGINPGQSAGGSLPALSVFGSTNSLVSTEDVQEFAILTSTYSAELGSLPGAQVSIVTRSGTNKFRGSVFDYLRNDAFDANDWFANRENLSRAALRQNDFGGTTGGPIRRDRSFFFVSFEGLQLRQPTSAGSDVPSLAARASAPTGVSPFLRAYPVPNGPEESNGLARAIYGFSNPSSLRSLSLRIDHHFTEALGMFARYAWSASDTQQRGGGSNSLSTVTDTHFGLQTLTTGLAYSVNPRTTNDLHFNWSRSTAVSSNRLDNFGGAIPLSPELVFPRGFDAQTGLFQFSPTLTSQSAVLALGRNVANTQTQINLVDDLSCQTHDHLIKVGVELRFLLPRIAPAAYGQLTFFPDIHAALNNTTLTGVIEASVPVHATFSSYSVFAEDTWRPSSRLSTTLGIRWDFAPAPRVQGANGLRPFAVTGFNNLRDLSLAPPGNALYRSSVHNLTPRLGFAYESRHSAKTQSVVKGGVGIYYDLSNGPVGATLSGFSFPFAAQSFVSGASLPLISSLASAPAITTNPPISFLQTFSAVLKTPYSYHWNLSLEQAIGIAQTVSISYVGAVGKQLLRTEEYIGGQAGVPAEFGEILRTDNSGYSNYNALQVKFERRVHRAQVTVSYALSHSLDNASTDAVFNGIPARFVDPRSDYGSSDFDIRQTATVGMHFDLPQVIKMDDLLKALIWGWSADPIVMMRSSPPVNPVISRDIGFGTYDFRPDLIPSAPLYVMDPSLPGKRRINVGALAVPVAPRQGNLGRNSLRGSPFFQTDLALRRTFRLSQRVHFQASVEAFNLLNHPNFAPPLAQMGVVDPTGNFIPQAGFGIPQTTLAQGLQAGFGSGFSPLYQIGASRSLQIALKIQF